LTRSVTKLKDIADELGLHPSSVSRAIAGQAGVSKAKRQLVLETATRLHYQPNALARGLRSGQQRVVGLVFPDVFNELYSSAATVLASNLASSGYLVHLSITYDHEDVERKALLSLVEHQVSGVIIAPCGPRDRVLSRALKTIPVVEFMRDTSARADKVLWDDEGAAFMATKHLLELGHRSIRFITGVPQVTTTVARVAGFNRALHEAGLGDCMDWVRFGRTAVDWHQATHELAQEVPRCSAVIASNHIIALSTLEALKSVSLAVPEDVSLVGLDDPSWFWAASDGITAVNMPWNLMAEAAGEFLLKRMSSLGKSKRGSKASTVRFPARLIVRGSTAPPRSLTVAPAMGDQIATQRTSRSKRDERAADGLR
jgi:LacI family transcriptional regulator